MGEYDQNTSYTHNVLKKLINVILKHRHQSTSIILNFLLPNKRNKCCWPSSHIC